MPSPDASRRNGVLGGRPKGLSPRTLRVKARLLQHEALTVTTVVAAMRRGVCYDIRALLDNKGNFRPIHTLTEEQAACIAGVEVVIKNAEGGDGHTDRVLKLRLVNRDKYIELAARHLGMLIEKLEIGASDELMARLLAGRQRAAEGPKLLTEAKGQ